MGMSINTNSVSINAQRNLGLSGNSLATSMQRLSSGLRVNSAKDDAAGLAIAERMNTQVKGLAVASRNANDGISLAQTAEGALGKVGDMLQRMRELAVQSGNATNSKTDREALQAELKQLRDEVDRVAKTTSFNGAKLLDGSFTGAVFQVGANSGDNITVGALANTKVDQLGKTTYAAVSHASITDTQKNAAGAALTSAAATITITGANGVSVTATVAKGDSVTGDEALGRALQAINSKTSDTGVVAFLSTDGKSIEYRASVKDGETAASVAVGSAQTDFNALISGTGAEKKVTGIAAVDIGTQAGAWEALQQIDKAIDKVNTARGELGAIQTRFEKTVENIDIQNENLTAARGRVVDADFAQETANLSRTQILQQAGTAMVAQANQLPQQVLSLLR
ncbi:flagellin [Comamonas denitrificans]|uniref:Flagellin n=1 Tax=Comamonas denitrificans TaxID=117506 RepID=A0A939GYD5_9BURK|nr:flagellin [Comamonas denitrificans]MBO1249592.1 flagellin [Comamonas denitrificans]